MPESATLKLLVQPVSDASALTAATVAQAAIDEALVAVPVVGAMPRHERAGVLERTAALIEVQGEPIARLIVDEAGKTIRQARKEVARAAHTLRLSADEARRNAGEVIPFDSFPGTEGRRGWFTREPLGLVVAITPYNDPLNLVAHKLGPAIAAGNAVLLKPAAPTMRTAQLFVDLLVEAGLPAAAVTVVQGDAEVGRALVSARAVRLVSFTGGFTTAEAISAAAGVKRLAMELGGNAPVLVFPDADFDKAVEACVSGAFWAAGQNCVGTQRVLVQEGLYRRFLTAFAKSTQELVVGDPHDETVDVGPMISVSAAQAARDLVVETVEAGAELVVGGALNGATLTPAVLTGVPRTSRLWQQEAFAPIVAIESFSTEEEAVRRANECEYALQAGVFTADLARALRVADALEAGGVMVNDSSDYRHDAMPFGGAKYGSMGREGVRFAYEEMTQPKVVAIAG
jgi:acyl-CoA reductase-like NAD-dependent aldehyde dehydrogenase